MATAASTIVAGRIVSAALLNRENPESRMCLKALRPFSPMTGRFGTEADEKEA